MAIESNLQQGHAEQRPKEPILGLAIKMQLLQVATILEGSQALGGKGVQLQARHASEILDWGYICHTGLFQPQRPELCQRQEVI